MAKGLNLTSSKIMEFHIQVNGVGDDADVWYLGDVYDDAGKYVRTARIDVRFSMLPSNLRAALNNGLRSFSREFNNETVDEDSNTWVNL